MNVLEKILEEIREIEKKYVVGHNVLFALGATGMATEISSIIRSHMVDVPKCGECSRRKWYQMGYEDGMQDVGDTDWIDCKDFMPTKDMDKKSVWIVYGSSVNLSVKFAYCDWVLSDNENGNDNSCSQFYIDQAPSLYYPSLNLVHYWKPVNIPEFKKRSGR